MNKIVAKAIDILEYASLKDKSFRIADVVRDLDVPKATAFNLIHTLVNKEMLKANDDGTKSFCLGSKAYYIGTRYMNLNLIQGVFTTELEQLGNALSTTVFMGILDNDKVLYLFKYTPPTAVLDPCTIGTKAEVYCTALGKCLIAFKESFNYDSITFKNLQTKLLLLLIS